MLEKPGNICRYVMFAPWKRKKTEGIDCVKMHKE